MLALGCRTILRAAGVAINMVPWATRRTWIAPRPSRYQACPQWPGYRQGPFIRAQCFSTAQLDVGASMRWASWVMEPRQTATYRLRYMALPLPRKFEQATITHVRRSPMAPFNVWGDSLYGALGNGTTEDVVWDTPVNVSNITTATAVSSAFGHSCALLSDGTVQCWGWNGDGELGNGTAGQASGVPVGGRSP